jgi:hypothetical protein
MPKETITLDADVLTSDATLTIAWSKPDNFLEHNGFIVRLSDDPNGQVLVNGHTIDKDALDKLIKTLMKARKQAYDNQTS